MLKDSGIKIRHAPTTKNRVLVHGSKIIVPTTKKTIWCGDKWVGIFNLFQRQSEEVNPAEVRTVSTLWNRFYSKHGERVLPIF